MTWTVKAEISDGAAREGGSRTSQVRKGEEARTTVSHRRLSGASLQLNISGWGVALIISNVGFQKCKCKRNANTDC